MRTGSKPVAGRLGVVTKNVVPLKAEPQGGWSTETVTTALIGQPVVAEGGQGEWLFVQTWDTYRGWIPAEAVRLFDDQPQPYASSGPVAIIRELLSDIMEQPNNKAAIITKVTISAELEVARTDGDWVELLLPDGRAGFIRSHEAKLIDKNIAQTIWLPDPKKLVETAMRFTGTPYLWGGTSPFGIDCSGFVQLIHRIHGVTLLRDAHMQAQDERAEPIDKASIRAGDLVFFGSGKARDIGTVTHVGMAVSNKRFIHSCGDSGVIVSSLADAEYNDIYWGARRMRLATLDPGGGAPED